MTSDKPYWDNSKDSEVTRRKYIKTLAATGVSSTTLLSQVSEAGASAGPSPDVPQFAKDKNKGWIFGTFNSPISNSSIRRVQNTVLKQVERKTDAEGAIVHDPSAKPKSNKIQEERQDRVLGYGFKWEDGGPNIYIIEEPAVISADGRGTLAPAEQLEVTEKAHRRINEFINSGGE